MIARRSRGPPKSNPLQRLERCRGRIHHDTPNMSIPRHPRRVAVSAFHEHISPGGVVAYQGLRGNKAHVVPIKPLCMEGPYVQVPFPPPAGRPRFTHRLPWTVMASSTLGKSSYVNGPDEVILPRGCCRFHWDASTMRVPCLRGHNQSPIARGLWKRLEPWP